MVFPRTPHSLPARWARSASAAPPRVEIDYDKKTVTASGQTFKEGDYLSIDGTSGTVYGGQIETAPSEIVTGMRQWRQSRAEDREVQELPAAHEMVRRRSRMDVRTNADTPSRRKSPSRSARSGIGLTRTEHMFFEGDRIDAMREMILATTVEDRKSRPREASSLPA